MAVNGTSTASGLRILHGLRQGAGVGLGGVVGQLGLVEHVHGVRAVGAQLGRQALHARADQHGRDLAAQGPGQAPRLGHGFQAGPPQLPVPLFRERQDSRHCQMTFASS